MALSACASIPGLNNIPMWHGDPAKLQALGKGAPMAEVDKALGNTRVLATDSIDVGGVPYQFRLYDWVQDTVLKKTVCSQSCTSNVDYVKVPYAIVYVGAEPRLHAWGTLKELDKSADPAVARESGQLLLRYYKIKYPR
ncbi:hypothetical protein [Massilia sp. TN1-12]|uniref:hypothetical protein n=1 Tax=Massilia paldalensis TaxID=3377675 RepID=UPI00385178CA